MHRLTYWGALAAALAVAVLFGFTTLADQLDNGVYDFLFRAHENTELREPTSVIYGIDEVTLSRGGGEPKKREILAAGLETLAAAEPKAVIIDLILADAIDPATDARLAAALAKLPNVVLASSLLPNSTWDSPRPEFARIAVAHVHADPDPYDNVVRRIPIEKAGGSDRRWALSFEAARAMEPGLEVEETPTMLRIGGSPLPSPQQEGRPMLVRFRPAADPIPTVSFAELADNPALKEKLQGRAVFVGLTAQSAAQDRHATPVSFGQTMVGVEVHANAYETIHQRAFLRRAGNGEIALTALVLVIIIGLFFQTVSGWKAYLLAGGCLALSHVIPLMSFAQGVVFPYTTLLGAVWLGTITAAAFQHVARGKRLHKTEHEKARYQEAIRFVTHEMRSPLTAIQGSSELMGRYKLPEEKRAEMAKMINTESKRLGKMITTFLDVEKLSDGEMQLKREAFSLPDLVSSCVDRAQPLAERKNITLDCAAMPAATLTGDRELMEYALYNLINNAIKYSSDGTRVSISTAAANGSLRLSVRDQGIGMDSTEVKKIFERFYRTKRAEATGEAGTGIGLSIVDQIVTHHGGRMEVESAPGAGSCFTVVIPISAVPSPAKVS